MEYNLPWRPDISPGRIEPDSDYAHRAMVKCTDGKNDFLIMVPPVQYRAPESKSEFIRILNDEMKDMRQRGLTLQHVAVRVGYKPGWEFTP